MRQTDQSVGRVNIFPGVDGGLYAYHGMEGTEAQLEKLPMTLPDLVDASPSLAEDGSVVVRASLWHKHLLLCRLYSFYVQHPTAVGFSAFRASLSSVGACLQLAACGCGCNSSLPPTSNSFRF